MNVTFLSLNFHLFYENSKRLCVFISKKHTKKRVRMVGGKESIAKTTFYRAAEQVNLFQFSSDFTYSWFVSNKITIHKGYVSYERDTKLYHNFFGHLKLNDTLNKLHS